MESKNVIKYEKDFSSPGEFEEEVASGEINLVGSLWPGKYDGEKWHEADVTEEESYLIYIYYFNKNKATIAFQAGYGDTPDMQPSFDLIRFVAKEFSIENTKDDRSTWVNPKSIRIGNSWKKTTTVKEVREILNYLKLEIKFPS